MGANASIYLPYDVIDLTDVFDDATSFRDTAGRTTHFGVLLNGENVRFNVISASELERHLQGFARYVDSLNEPEDCKKDARMLIEHTKIVLGLVAESEFEENPSLWKSLFQVADKWDGFIFAFDSIVLPSGGVIVGPLKSNDN